MALGLNKSMENQGTEIKKGYVEREKGRAGIISYNIVE